MSNHSVVLLKLVQHCMPSVNNLINLKNTPAKHAYNLYAVYNKHISYFTIKIQSGNKICKYSKTNLIYTFDCEHKFEYRFPFPLENLIEKKTPNVPKE